MLLEERRFYSKSACDGYRNSSLYIWRSSCVANFDEERVEEHDVLGCRECEVQSVNALVADDDAPRTWWNGSNSVLLF